jgi:hypothetical protein
VDQHESSYNACFKADAYFGAKGLGLVDLTFFQLCDNCLRAQTIEEVDFTAIVLNNKRFDIVQNCFQANKPAYLTQMPKKIHGVDGNNGDDAGKDGRKKLKSLKEGGGKFCDLGAFEITLYNNQPGCQAADENTKTAITTWRLPACTSTLGIVLGVTDADRAFNFLGVLLFERCLEPLSLNSAL